MSKFTTHQSHCNNGFTMKFKNGWTISVQFGKVNHATIIDGINVSAEIAIWNDQDSSEYYFPDGRQVKGWVSADEVADWIHRVSKW